MPLVISIKNFICSRDKKKNFGSSNIWLRKIKWILDTFKWDQDSDLYCIKMKIIILQVILISPTKSSVPISFFRKHCVIHTQFSISTRWIANYQKVGCRMGSHLQLYTNVWRLKRMYSLICIIQFQGSKTSISSTCLKPREFSVNTFIKRGKKVRYVSNYVIE